MKTVSGTGVTGGVAVGRIRYYSSRTMEVTETRSEDTVLELARFDDARIRVRKQQHMLYEKAMDVANTESAGIFLAHEVILDDGVWIGICRKFIEEENYTAGAAVSQGFDLMIRRLMDSQNPFFQDRSGDVVDIKNAMLDVLMGQEDSTIEEAQPVILLAEDLTPTQLMKLDKSMLAGLVLRKGTAFSHTTILARELNLPMLIRCADISEVWDGSMAALEPGRGCMTVEPDRAFLDALAARRKETHTVITVPHEPEKYPAETQDGHVLHVRANISGPQEIDAALSGGAEGIGLFRSELLYLSTETEPSEEVQFAVYRHVAAAFPGQPVIIRTCDLSADKEVAWLPGDKGINPALGLKGIRVSLANREFFKRQLRALLRASVFGKIGILFPMITGAAEVKTCKEILEECRQELDGEGSDIGRPRIGIMIETPAAALCADELAQEVDFFSLGTNDLLQYTCAADRDNAQLADLADPHHPALLRLIQMTVEAGHRQGIRVGICGELAADLTMTEDLLRMGIDELSVHPGSVQRVREQIRSIRLD
ncbi:MAG: phosphoenolpyruvate--protein phosphotransferase [Butyrivibrio sp.]|nr:phosphoenolpyruvate--protein phosphotransferase [Butyrivibrio sp.]